MDDLISRKELFSEMLQFRQKIMNHENPKQQRLPNWNDAVSLIGSAPAADAVLVVRCRDCKHWKDQSGTPKWLPCVEIQTSGMWYCADGERRED